MSQREILIRCIAAAVYTTARNLVPSLSEQTTHLCLPLWDKLLPQEQEKFLKFAQEFLESVEKGELGYYAVAQSS